MESKNKTYTMKILEEERAAAKYINKNKQENNNSTNLRISRPCRSVIQGNISQFNLFPGNESNYHQSAKSIARAAWRPPGVVSRGVVCSSYQKRSKISHSLSNSEDESN
nr:hypothetical transcript [Hymenolepis microstoma]